VRRLPSICVEIWVVESAAVSRKRRKTVASIGSSSIAWRHASICMSADVIRGVIRKFGLNMLEW
jgi:hypothetical protein